MKKMMMLAAIAATLVSCGGGGGRPQFGDNEYPVVTDQCKGRSDGKCRPDAVCT